MNFLSEPQPRLAGTLGSLGFKIGAFAFLLILAMTAVFSLITARNTSRRITDELVMRAHSLAATMAAAAAYSFSSGDLLGLDNIVFRGKEANRDVEYVIIADNDRKAVVHSTIEESGRTLGPAGGTVIREEPDGTVARELAGDASLLEIATPVVFLGRRLGTVIVGINTSLLAGARDADRRNALAAFGVTALFGILGSLLLSTYFTRPIKELSSGVEELINGRRSRPLTVYSRDELGRLSASFNEMSATISAQRARLEESAGNLEEAYVSIVKVLAATIDARDEYTHGHSRRVSILSVQVGRAMGLDQKQVRDLEVACLFHDIGKIRTPDAILRKNGKLTAAEHQEMMRHTEYGAEILSKAPSLVRYIPPVRHHHEWYDGTGYPDGLRGEAIDLYAAIIGVADAYDAMTSDRPYRRARTHEEAVRELLAFSGRQFHPDILERFVTVVVPAPAEEADRVSVGEPS